jgi:hypothetical protein
VRDTDWKRAEDRRNRKLRRRLSQISMKNNEGNVTNWHMRIFLASCVRLTVGYMFLAALFANIVQNDSVISIFYSVMALDFVENIDDHAFALAKRGFFGLSLMSATKKDMNSAFQSDVVYPKRHGHTDLPRSFILQMH